MTAQENASRVSPALPQRRRDPDMSKLKLTDAAIDKLALPDGKSEVFFWDSDIPGFGLRWRAGGDRTWVFQFRVGARGRRMTLGKCSALSASTARATAVKLYARIKLGEDPAADKAKAATALAETFLDGVNVYLKRQAQRLRARSLVEVTRHLNVNAKPLHRLPLAGIDRRTVSKLISTLAENRGPVAANRTGSSIAAFFAWAIREGWIDVNPAVTLNKQHEQPRARVLTDDEIRKIWAATSGTDQHSAIIRLLLLTGCRREEVGGLRWSEIDFDKALIVLPPERTKGGREHLVPLSAMAMEIIEAQPRRDRAHVFGERPTRGYGGWSQGKATLDADAKVAGWVVHDLRRSVSTKLNGELGVQPHVVERILGHHLGGISGVYNRASYLNEMRQALALWSERVAAIVEDRPAKVVSLRA
jgi:integrase